MESPPYEPVRDMGALKDLLTDKLEEYGLEPGANPLDLVLFRYAGVPVLGAVTFARSQE